MSVKSVYRKTKVEFIKKKKNDFVNFIKPRVTNLYDISNILNSKF